MDVPADIIANLSEDKQIVGADQGDEFVVQYDAQMDRPLRSFLMQVLFIELEENKDEDLQKYTGQVRIGPYKCDIEVDWSQHFEMVERLRVSNPVIVEAAEGVALPAIEFPLELTHDFSVGYVEPSAVDRLGDLVGRAVAGVVRVVDNVRDVIGNLLRPGGKRLVDGVSGDAFVVDFIDDDGENRQLLVQLISIGLNQIDQGQYGWDNYGGRLQIGGNVYQFSMRARDGEPGVIVLGHLPGVGGSPPIPDGFQIRQIRAVQFVERPPV